MQKIDLNLCKEPFGINQQLQRSSNEQNDSLDNDILDINHVNVINQIDYSTEFKKIIKYKLEKYIKASELLYSWSKLFSKIEFGNEDPSNLDSILEKYNQNFSGQNIFMEFRQQKLNTVNLELKEKDILIMFRQYVIERFSKKYQFLYNCTYQLRDLFNQYINYFTKDEVSHMEFLLLDVFHNIYIIKSFVEQYPLSNIYYLNYNR